MENSLFFGRAHYNGQSPGGNLDAAPDRDCSGRFGALASLKPLWDVAPNDRDFDMDAPGQTTANAPGKASGPAFPQKVFSGVQPTGNLHLGNYLGAITKFVDLQDRYDCIYCVVDMHAITVWQEPQELTRAIREVTAAFIACGID